MPSLGPAEILVILVIALLVFGPNKMPDIARQVGKGMRELKRMQQHLGTELRDVVAEFDGSTESMPEAAAGGDPVPMLPPKPDTASIDTASTDAAEPAEPTAPTADAPLPRAVERGERVWPPPASFTGS